MKYTAVMLMYYGLGRSVADVTEPDMQGRIIQEIDQAERYREDNLSGYTVTEHYTISNSHFSSPAEVVVETTYTRGPGKTYRVLSRTGPSLLKDRVMDRMLEEEANMSHGTARAQSLIVSGNYEMRLMGEENIGGTACYALQLIPKSRSARLLTGRLWVDSRNKTPVRVVGQPPVSESFLAGRPEIVRDYLSLDGFALAQRSHATTAGLLQGKTEITIVYDKYVVTRYPQAGPRLP